ncbi:MAG: YitT family protein [Oscillospiraceae bacterium]|nr:YitT family protein [Oscillospiraceae bacterium]
MKNRFLSFLRELKPINFLLLTAAGIINSIGVTMFLAPVQLYDSGISGTSMLLGSITPPEFTLSLFLLLLNIPLFLFGLKKQGPVFTVYSIWAVLIYSASSFVITNILPVDVATSSPFAGQDLLLCALFGGLISGIGSGMTIRFGGAIDGIEVMAVIFAKQLGLTVGTFVMVYNVVLYILIGCIFQSWILPLYSIVTYCVAIKAVDFIVDGLDKAKSAMIVTTKANEISEALSEAFGRGVTHIGAKGFYSGKDQTIIYFVVNRFQVARMKQIVTSKDPNAFIAITEVSDLLGKSVKK